MEINIMMLISRTRTLYMVALVTETTWCGETYSLLQAPYELGYLKDACVFVCIFRVLSFWLRLPIE